MNFLIAFTTEFEGHTHIHRGWKVVQECTRVGLQLHILERFRSCGVLYFVYYLILFKISTHCYASR